MRHILAAATITLALLPTTAPAVDRKFDKGDERHLYQVYLTQLRATFCNQQFGLPSASVVADFGPAVDWRLRDLGDEKRAKILMAWAEADYDDLDEADCKRVQNATDALFNYRF